MSILADNGYSIFTDMKNPAMLPRPDIRPAQALPNSCSDFGRVSTKMAREHAMTALTEKSIKQMENTASHIVKRSRCRTFACLGRRRDITTSHLHARREGQILRPLLLYNQGATARLQTPRCHQLNRGAVDQIVKCIGRRTHLREYADK
jgi:hypothetical protein